MSPIPSMRELAKVTTPQGLHQAYVKNGWFKFLEFNWVNYDSRRDVWTVTKYTCDASKLTCGCGESASLVAFYPSGIISTCKACAVTSGPLGLDDRAFSVISVSRISKAEGVRMLRDSGQVPPVGQDHRMKVQSRYERFKRINQ